MTWNDLYRQLRFLHLRHVIVPENGPRLQRRFGSLSLFPVLLDTTTELCTHTTMEDFQVYTQEQIEWMLHPKFAEETILACPIPSQMGNDAAALWLAICGSREFPIFLSTLPIGVEEQAVLAARRILKLEELYQTTDGSQWPTLLILLSECHFLLNDTPGARMMVEEAQAILGLGRDESLDQCLDILKAIETSETLDDGGTGDEELDEIIYYERPPVYVPSTQPSNLIRLQMRWATMKAENDGAEQFARLACVETNELENVFDLDGDSAMKLARCGFFANSIAGISHQSRIKKKDKILRILENTQRCFNITKQNCFEKNSVLECFEKKSVIVLHALLMKESKVELDEIEYPKYTPTGRYRHAFGYTTQENVNGGVTEVRYCPAVDIEEHMVPSKSSRNPISSRTGYGSLPRSRLDPMGFCPYSSIRRRKWTNVSIAVVNSTDFERSSTCLRVESFEDTIPSSLDKSR
jgi:hypothetical protein